MIVRCIDFLLKIFVLQCHHATPLGGCVVALRSVLSSRFFLLPLAVSVVVVVFFSYHLVSIRWLLFLCDLALRYARRSDCTYGGSVIT